MCNWLTRAYVTANRHVGSWNWHQYTHRLEVKNDNTVWSHMLSRACPPNTKDIRCAFTYLMKMPSTVRLNSGHFHHNRHRSLCPLSMSTEVLILLINYCQKLYQIHPNMKKQHYFSLEDAINKPWRSSRAKVRLKSHFCKRLLHKHETLPFTRVNVEALSKTHLS